MADRLKGKVALVVGAGSIGPGWGNGKATAVAFAREGARVFCADINLAAAQETARIISAEGGQAGQTSPQLCRDDLRDPGLPLSVPHESDEGPRRPRTR